MITENTAINGNDLPPVRLAHFSDIHVTAPQCLWRMRDWFNKRMSAWLNLNVLGRSWHFRHTDRILTALRSEFNARNYHHLVFSGDATAMGFEEELRRAVELFGDSYRMPGLAVPGNHDYCTRAAMLSGHFEQYFAAWQQGERLAEAVYPFAQRVGPYWLVGVNSATANRLAWDARGQVGATQLERLETLLAGLSSGPRILVTHYPIWLASGKPEKAYHGLRDMDDLVSIAQRGGVVLWLHGHRHESYHHPQSERVPFPVICAGSTTQQGSWSYHDYTLTGPHLRAVQRVFDEKQGMFRDGRTFELQLAKGTPRPAGTESPQDAAKLTS